MSTSAPSQAVSNSRARRSNVSRHLLKLHNGPFPLTGGVLGNSSDKRHSFFLEQANG